MVFVVSQKHFSFLQKFFNKLKVPFCVFILKYGFFALLRMTETVVIARSASDVAIRFNKTQKAAANQAFRFIPAPDFRSGYEPFGVRLKKLSYARQTLNINLRYLRHFRVQWGLYHRFRLLRCSGYGAENSP